MKKNLPTILCFVFCFGFSSLWSQNIPEVLYYKFDGSGTTVPNYASAPPAGTTTATIMGGITQGGSGTLCSGTLVGSGNASSTDYLNTGWVPNLGTSSWTISFRTSGISTNATLYYIFGDLNTNSFRCFTNGIAGATNWLLRGAGLTDIYLNGGALMTPSMCTFVYDNTLGEVKGYLDGVLVTTVAQGAVNLTGTGSLKVMGYSTNVGAPAGGLVDEFRVYSRALTAAEVLELYNPYATAGFLGPDLYVCPGSPIQSDLIWPTTTVLWSNGSMADSLLINTPDTFSVNISGACGNGADTIIFINAQTFDTITPTTCGSYVSPSGSSYTMTGNYSDTIPNSLGCDSIINIALTVNNANVGVTQSGTSGDSLNANAVSATYQWIDCSTNNPVGGATSQAYIATANGSYAVIVTQNGCTDTSACFVVAGLGVDQNILSELVKLYPNPTTGTFNISLGMINQDFTIELINNVGQVIKSSMFTNTNLGTFDIDGIDGLYFVRITNTQGEKVVLRIIKE